jgi:methyl-accepting chemotaxis protein
MTTRVLGLCFFSVIVCVGLYCALLPLAINYDRETTISFIKRMLIVGTVFDGLCTFVVYLVYRPVARALRSLETSGSIGTAEFQSAGKAMNRIPNFLFAFGAFSYVFAYSLNLGIDALAGIVSPADQIISRVIGALSFGVLNGLICERLMNLEFIHIKMRLGIIHLSELSRFQRFSSLQNKLMTPTTVLFVFVIAFSGLTFFNLSKHVAQSVVVAATEAAAGSGAGEGSAGAVESAARAAADSAYAKATGSAMIVFAGLLVSSVVIFRVFIRELYKNVAAIRNQLELQGEGFDLSRRIFITSNDDVGYLGAGINDLMDRLTATFGEVKSMSNRVQSSSQEAARLVGESRDTAETIATSLKRVERRTLDEAKDIDELARGIEGMTVALAGYAEGAAAQSRSASEAIDRTRLFVEAFEAAVRESAATEAFYRELEDAFEVAGKEIDKAKGAAIDTVEMGRRISGIVASIVDIADRSSLLAMNASIEAAHAGAAGKGFAVLAKEIKSLAESSSSSSGHIVEQIKGMQEKNTAGAMSIDELVASFKALSERIAEAGRKASERAASYRSRSELASGAMAGLSGLLSATKLMEADAQARLKEQKGIEAAIRRLESGAETLKTETGELFSGVKEVLRISRDLDLDMGENSKAVDALESKMALYTLKA